METIFIVLYVVFIVVGLGFEIYLLCNNEQQFISNSIKRLNVLFERDSKMNDGGYIASELNEFYNEYARQYPKIKKYFPNVLLWINAIVFRIDTTKKIPLLIQEKESLIKEARNILEKKNLFYECSASQKRILDDISNLSVDNNNTTSLVNRIKEEFVKQNLDNEKNRRNNLISVVIGIVGIVVSVILSVLTK